MTDLIMPISVAVLVPLCAYLGFRWLRCAQEAEVAKWRKECAENRLDYASNVYNRATEISRDRLANLSVSLAYYADKSNWQSEAGKHSPVYKDKGAIARKALGVGQ